MPDYCEELLAMAKAGKIRSLGVVYVDTQAYVGTGYVTSGCPHAPHLLAGDRLDPDDRRHGHLR